MADGRPRFSSPWAVLLVGVGREVPRGCPLCWRVRGHGSRETVTQVLRAEGREVLDYVTSSSKPQAGQRPGVSVSVWEWHSLTPRARRRHRWHRIQKGKIHPQMEFPVGSRLQDPKGKEKTRQAPQVWGCLPSLTSGIRRPLINIGCLKSNVDGQNAQPWAAVEGMRALETDCLGVKPQLCLFPDR